MSMSKGGSVPQLRWSSVSRAASDRIVAAIAKPETPFVRVDLGDQISGNAWRVFHLDKKAGFEREISFGGFEHLAVPLRLLGKDGSVGTIAFVGKACYAARTTRAGLGLSLNRLWLAALGCGFCLPVVEIIDAPTLHWWVEHWAPLQASTSSSCATSGKPSRTRNSSSFQEPRRGVPREAEASALSEAQHRPL